jgi:hypothetical protein
LTVVGKLKDDRLRGIYRESGNIVPLCTVHHMIIRMKREIQ